MGYCGPRAWGITGVVITIGAAIFASTFSYMISSIVDQQLALNNGTIMFSFWESSPVPMYMRLYLFNVTNHEAVLSRQAIPELEQLGPYTYSEEHVRVKRKFFDNATIQFQQERYWKFVPELSNGSLDDPVTSVNPIVVSASFILRDFPQAIKNMFNVGLLSFGSTYFITRPAGEFLFDGFRDPLLDIANQFPEGIFPPYDKFGWFYNRNGSADYDGVFNIFSGTDDISKLLSMDTWNGVKQTNFYESYCGMVNGSFGEGWPPYRERTEISMYSTDLCRSITLDYVEDVSDSGITFYRYAGTKRMFANATENPDNWCFCPDGQCHPSGVVNSSPCRYGTPAFVSFPHFYNADPFFLRQVRGMEPQRHLHEFHIDLEPRTAVPLQVNARFQINLLMEPIDGIPITKDVPRTYLPITWFGVSADLRDKPSLVYWINFVTDAPLIGTIVFWGFFLIGIAMVAITAVYYVKHRKTKSNRMV